MKKQIIATLVAASLATVLGMTVSADGVKIGFSSKDNSDTFVAAITDAAADEAEKLGVDLMMMDAAGDVNQQISDVETMIAAGCQAIVVIPQDIEGSAPVVSMCNEAGIPIIIDNGDIADTNFTAFVGCTDQESGELLGQWMKDNLAEGTKVCIIEGPMGQSGQVGRHAGFVEVGLITEDDQSAYLDLLAIQTANWKRDQAMALAEDWITTYGDELGAIICENDDMAMGALSACEAADRSDIVIGGVDGLGDAVAAVAAGKYGVSVLQDADGQGRVGVQVALAAANGEDFEKDTRIPFRPITAENVEAYLKDGVSALQ